MLYLIVSIPDLCRLSYFVHKTNIPPLDLFKKCYGNTKIFDYISYKYFCLLTTDQPVHAHNLINSTFRIGFLGTSLVCVCEQINVVLLTYTCMFDMAKRIPINHMYCIVLCLTWSQILKVYFLASWPIQDPFTYLNFPLHKINWTTPPSLRPPLIC